MIKLIFLNREILKIDDFSKCIIVPLNAIAMRDILLANINYIKIEEFIDYNFCKNNKENIWHLFQQILDKADEVIAQIYGNQKFKTYGPFNLFAMGIRQMFDTMVQYYIIFNGIVSQVKPDKIELLTREYHVLSSEITVDKFINIFYKRILEKIAVKNNVQLGYHVIEPIKSKNGKKVNKRNIIIQKAIKWIKESSSYLNLKKEINEPDVKKINEKALFLQYDWGVYYYSQYFSNIIKLFQIKDIVVNNNKKYNLSYKVLLEALQTDISLLSNLFDFNVGYFMEEIFKEYTKKVPFIISCALRSEKYLKQIKPRFVFFTNLYGNMLPLQMALCWDKNIIKVEKQHGDTMFDVTVWRNNELKPADIYITEFKEIAEYWRYSAALADINIRCECDGIRVNKYYGKAKTKNKLVYVPGFLDPRLSFDMERIPQPLFFRVQIRILEVLNQQKEFDDVVYKCLPPGQHDFHFPVPEYIKAYFKNIRISQKALSKELRDARACLVDAPLSSMWEAINMNVPCQALVWNKNHLRPTAVAQYEKYLTFYDSDIDVSEKLNIILKRKRFHTLDDRERKLMKRNADEITAMFISAMSK